MSNWKMNDRQLFKLIWSYARPHMSLLAGVISFLILNIGFNIVGPLLINYVLEAMEQGNIPSQQLLLQISIIYILVSLFAWLFSAIQFVFVSKLNARVIRDLRIDAYSSILQNNVSFYDDQKSGDLTSRLINDTRDLSESAVSIAYVFTAIFRLVMVLGVFFYFSAVLALAAVITLPIVMIFAVYLGKFERRVSDVWRKRFGEVNSNFSEIMSKIQISKAFHREEENLNRFSTVNEATYKASVKRGFAIFIFWPITDLMKHGLTLLILGVGVWQVDQGNISIATLILFLVLLGYFYWPLITIANNYHRFQGAFASLDRIAKVAYNPNFKENSINNNHLERLHGSIQFQDVSFGYLPDELVIKDLNFMINPGQRVAIVGHTGAGKSTIASLLMRFYPINSGKIFIDDDEIYDYDLHYLRQEVSMVSQRVLLFKGTIRDNLLIANPSATDDQLWEILDQVKSREFIEQLPRGLDHIVDENGKNLSAGQRQMISFARVLLSDPSIVILDEATSAVDLYTESKIQEAIDVLLESKTSISIAHRLTTILKSDIILVMENGRLVEMGSHDDLLDLGGKYADMYKIYLETQSAKYLETIKR